MKLVSSSPEPKHHHRVKSNRSWLWPRVRSRVLTPRLITSLAWLLLVIIVAAFAIFVFHSFRQTMDAVAGQQ